MADKNQIVLVNFISMIFRHTSLVQSRLIPRQPGNEASEKNLNVPAC